MVNTGEQSRMYVQNEHEGEFTVPANSEDALSFSIYVFFTMHFPLSDCYILSITSRITTLFCHSEGLTSNYVNYV